MVEGLPLTKGRIAIAQLVLTTVDEVVLDQLQERAALHGRSSAEEATVILAEVLRGQGSHDWSPVDAIYHRLASSGINFCDNAELLREDRDR